MNLYSIHELCVWTMQFPGRMRCLIAVGVSAMIWGLWKCRNNACFRNIYPYDPSSVIVQVAHWLEFWAGLQKRGFRESQARGAKLLLQVAPVVLRIVG